VLLTDGGEPESYEEAMSHQEEDKWYKAMQKMKSLQENCNISVDITNFK